MNEITLFLVRLGLVLVAAHGTGFFFARVLNLPRVLGEMSIGILLSYNLLGSLPIVFGEKLFTPEIMSHEIFEFFTSMATIILLFNAGMHTDIRFFLRFFMRGALIGLSGVVISFLAAAYITVLLIPGVEGLGDPIAIFMGIATSTSVGISARILTDKNKLNSIEGNLSITAAVLDDVLGIIALSVATAIAIATGKGLALDGMQIAWIAGREIFFWLFLTVVGVIVARLIGRYFRILTPYTAIGMSAIGFVLIMGGIAESLGLSAVIGAYILGLGFNSIDTSKEIQERIEDLSGFFIPVFFTLTCIQIDFIGMKAGLLFSILYAVISLIAKVLACGGAASILGFNLRGAFRIGTIMLPRGEVTLVIANIGIALGVLNAELFGTLAFTVFLSILTTPLALMLTFKSNKSGYKKALPVSEELETFSLEALNGITQSYLFDKIMEAFQKSEYFIYSLDNTRRAFLFRKRDISVTMRKSRDGIVFSVQQANMKLVKLLVLEEIADMKGNLETLQQLQSKEHSLERGLMSGILMKEEAKK